VKGKDSLADTAGHKQPTDSKPNSLFLLLLSLGRFVFAAWINFLTGKTDWQRSFLSLSFLCTLWDLWVERYWRCV